MFVVVVAILGCTASELQPVPTSTPVNTCTDLSSSCELCRAKGCAWCTTSNRCVSDAIGACDHRGHLGLISGRWICPNEDQAQQRLAGKPGALSECLLMGRVTGFQTGTIEMAAARIPTGGWLHLRRANKPWSLFWCRVVPGKKPKYRPQLRCLPRPPSFSPNNASNLIPNDAPSGTAPVSRGPPPTVIKLHRCHSLSVSTIRPPVGKKSIQLACRPSNVIMAGTHRESQRQWVRVLTMAITAQLCSKGLKAKRGHHAGQEQSQHENDRAMAQLTAAVRC